MSETNENIKTPGANVTITKLFGFTMEEAQATLDFSKALRRVAEEAGPNPPSVSEWYTNEIFPTLNEIARKQSPVGIGRELNEAERAELELEILDEYHNVPPPDLTSAINMAAVRGIASTTAIVDPTGTEATIFLYTFGEFSGGFTIVGSPEEINNIIMNSDIDWEAIGFKVFWLAFALFGFSAGGAIARRARKLWNKIKNKPAIRNAVDGLIAGLRGENRGARSGGILKLVKDLVTAIAGDDDAWQFLKELIGGWWGAIKALGRLLVRLIPGIGLVLAIGGIAGPLLNILDEMCLPIPGWLLKILGQGEGSEKQATLRLPAEDFSVIRRPGKLIINGNGYPSFDELPTR